MICCITNRHLCQEGLINCMQSVLQDDVDYVIMREKDLPAREALYLATKLRRLTDDYHKPLIVNSFIDIARTIHADGIHLPYPMFVNECQNISDFSMKGVSVHSVKEAVDAQKRGASYILAGNIFETACKEGLPGRGISFVKALAKAVDIPIWAVGGITKKNMTPVLAAGAQVVCMMSSFMR